MSEIVSPEVEIALAPAKSMARAFQDGCLVILSIGMPSWTVAASNEILGIEKLPDNVDPAKLLLLPPEPLKLIKQIEGASRRFLDSQSVVYGSQRRANFRFVREAMMINTLIGLKDYSTKYFEVVDQMLADLPKHRETMKEKFPAQWPFVEQYHQIPADKLRAKYYFTYESMAMSMPKGVDGIGLDELLRRQSIRGEISAEYRAKAELVLQEQRQHAQARATEFVESTIRGLRSQVTKAFRQVSDKLRTGGGIIKTNVDTIRRNINSIRALDFLDDAEFRRHLNEVEALVDKTGEWKDNAEASRELQALLNKTINFVDTTTDATVAAKTKSYFARNLDLS